MKQRILNILIALDQLLWTLITLGKGKPDETISAALWRLESQGKIAGKLFRPVVDTLFWFDKNHCQQSYLAEINREHLSDFYKKTEVV